MTIRNIIQKGGLTLLVGALIGCEGNSSSQVIPSKGPAATPASTTNNNFDNIIYPTSEQRIPVPNSEENRISSLQTRYKFATEEEGDALLDGRLAEYVSIGYIDSYEMNKVIDCNGTPVEVDVYIILNDSSEYAVWYQSTGEGNHDAEKILLEAEGIGWGLIERCEYDFVAGRLGRIRVAGWPSGIIFEKDFLGEGLEDVF